MAATGKLVGLTAAQLTDIQNAAQQCIVANAVRGISYNIAGRAFTFPGLPDAQDLLQEANYALGLLNGTTSQNVVPNFNLAFNRQS